MSVTDIYALSVDAVVAAAITAFDHEAVIVPADNTVHIKMTEIALKAFVLQSMCHLRAK